jgi:4-hydroxyacetophenone monooxygenase
MAVANSVRAELLDATDEQIEQAVEYADPMVLRGLLFQLTGDESVVAMPVHDVTAGWIDVTALADDGDARRLRAKAVRFLKSYRDAGAGEIEIGPAERLPQSLAMAAGKERLPEEDLPVWLEELALDRWARGLRWEEVPPAKQLQGFSVLVIGAGMGGLNAAAQLKHAGVEFTVIEKNSEVGGTWWESRYPGARVDSPSRGYQHILGADYMAPYPFCPQVENQRYFDWVADTYALRDSIVFDTEVRSLAWDEDTAEWIVEAEGPTGRREWRANAVITAVGFLSRPNIPELDGMSDFQGLMFHTARWPQDLDLAGKRFAVIGTGCTGYQMTPELARDAGHVYVFQRTPQWLFDLPGYLSPFPEQVTWLDRNFPYYANFMRFVTMWYAGPEVARRSIDIDPDFDDPHTRSAYNKRIRDGRIEFLERKLADRPELVAKMLPEHPPFSARPVLCDSEYSIVDALLLDNVTLITDGVERITPTGIRSTTGEEYEVDVIVFATGYKANDFLWPMEVRGRGGRPVEELWAIDGPRAYLGAMLPGFPNLFMIYGPNTNPYGGGGGVVPFEEIITRYALRCIRYLILNDKRSLDPTEQAYWRYNDLLDQEEARKLYSDPRANNYFRNAHGRSATNSPFTCPTMWRWLRDPDTDDLIVD